MSAEKEAAWETASSCKGVLVLFVGIAFREVHKLFKAGSEAQWGKNCSKEC